MSKISQVNNAASKLLALKLIIEQCQRGEHIGAKDLRREFEPLIQSLAVRRSRGDRAEQARLVEQGVEGLLKAARKFKLSTDVAKFNLFAVNHIQKAMDGKNKGFFARILGR
jgi:DNA-directed RNA polymerase specialized sigma subunit